MTSADTSMPSTEGRDAPGDVERDGARSAADVEHRRAEKPKHDVCGGIVDRAPAM